MEGEHGIPIRIMIIWDAPLMYTMTATTTSTSTGSGSILNYGDDFNPLLVEK